MLQWAVPLERDGGRESPERPSRDLGVLEDLIGQEAGLVGRQVVAPSLGGGRLRVRAGTMVYECWLETRHRGWGVFRVRRGRASELVAVFERDAEVWERERVLRRAPRRALVLFHRDRAGSWWGWDAVSGATIPVELVEGMDLFDGVSAAFDGGMHWFAGSSALVSPQRSQSLREAYAGGVDARELQSPGSSTRERDAYAMACCLRAAPLPVEARLERALRLGQARLVSYAEVSGGYRVTWSKGANMLQSVVDRDLGVITAGLCLRGGDRLQDLSSLASLVPVAPVRPDYEGHGW